MRNHRIVILLVILALMNGPSCAEVVDKIAVVVNNEIITEAEINRMVMPIYERYRTMYKGDDLVKRLEEARQIVIAQLIDEKVILSEAKRLNVEVAERDVSDRLDMTIKRFGSRENFEKELSGQHITLKELRARYRDQLMVQRLIDGRISAKVTVTPAEAGNYYNAHLDEFVMPGELTLRNILIKPKSDLLPAAKALTLAKEISRRLKEGGDFAGLAKVYSEGPNAQEGGLMEHVKKGDLLPEIEKVVFELPVGGFSDIIQTSVGYHIFKVEERKEPTPLSFPEARREIEERIFMEKTKAKAEEWVKDLKKNAYIAIR